MGDRVADPRGEGLRERKRRETLARITDAGMSLFIAKGYEGTTIDEIAEKAGISRRTFFYYFKSKDEILLSLQAGVGDMLVEAVRGAPPDGGPLDTVREAVLAVCALIPAADMIEIDRLMRASPAVQARKQASYVEQENALFGALKERWPAAERETGLRLVAMMAVGAMRLATETFNREGGRRPIGTVFGSVFDALECEMSDRRL